MCCVSLVHLHVNISGMDYIWLVAFNYDFFNCSSTGIWVQGDSGIGWNIQANPDILYIQQRKIRANFWVKVT
jgi:hypothetical protein